MANPNWTKGTSGNPSGRPPKHRALTEILRKRGSRRVLCADGKQRPGNNVVADALWELVTTGSAELFDGESVKDIAVGAKGWFEIVKWLYSQIDGPPKGEIDLTSGGQSFFDLPEWQRKRNERLESLKDE